MAYPKGKTHRGWNKGKKWSDETKQKMRLAHLGRQIPKKSREKMSLSKSRNKNPNWSGGGIVFCSETANRVYRESHPNVVCEKCGSSEDIVIHHKDKNRRNNSIINLQALCRKCHLDSHDYQRGKSGRKKR